MVIPLIAPEQIEEEFKKILQLIIDVCEDLTDYRFRLSYRDPEDKHKYFDNDEMWENAQRMLKAAVDDMGVEYYEAEGGKPSTDQVRFQVAVLVKKLFQLSNWT